MSGVVLLIERTRAMREALRAPGVAEGLVVLHAPSLRAARGLPLQPALVCADITADSAEGVGDSIAVLSQRFHPIPVVAVGSAEDSHVTSAIKAGARGYLFREDVPRLLGSSIRQALEGGAPFSGAAALVVLARARRRSGVLAAVAAPTVATPAPPAVCPLSPTHQHVLGKLAEGFSYEQIALELGVSINTVRTHVRAIYERLGASSKMEAVRKATRAGMLDPRVD